jgi:hypothetical protein
MTPATFAQRDENNRLFARIRLLYTDKETSDKALTTTKKFTQVVTDTFPPVQ